MRSRSRLLAVVFLSVISVSALASELTVRVIDSSSAAVFGAHVEIYAENSARPVAIGITSAQGTAHFENLPDTGLRIRVLAPGFAEQWQSPATEANHASSTITLALK